MAGRPKKKLADGTEKYDVEAMCGKIEEYIEANKEGIPILKECCFENNWNYDYVMELQRENPVLSQSTKRLLCKKEVNLEKGSLFGTLNSSQAIFSLKQLGWTDKRETELSSGDKPFEVNINVIK